MRVRDTLGGGMVELGPGGDVGIYLCGVTAYDESHIGHARTVIVFDVLRRRLEATGARVRLVQNFTDVDDKIIERAAAEGTTAAELSSRHMAEYHDTFGRLNVLPASEYPLATEHVPDMVRLASELVERGAAYEAGGDVYFSVGSFAGYGRLSGKDTGALRAGARVPAGEHKRDPLDFALWKASGGEPSWDSPWGRGRPGWHIECSAMSLRHLGESFDVHGGGRDLIFPHHENEIAQTQSRTGRQPARAWVHVGMVTVGGEKMSKSLGNARSARRLLEEWGPNVVRLFCLGAHYPKPVDYTDAAMAEHRANWDRARLAIHSLEQGGGAGGAGPGDAARIRAEFDAALDDDLDTRLAVGALHRLASLCVSGGGGGGPGRGAALGALRYMAGVLGLAVPELPGPEREAVEGMVARRAALRARGMYGEADEIRGRLAAMGVELSDAGGRTVWLASERPARGGTP